LPIGNNILKPEYCNFLHVGWELIISDMDLHTVIINTLLKPPAEYVCAMTEKKSNTRAIDA
jgi:hypothetical protein